MSYFPSLRKLVHFLALNVFLANLSHLGRADPPYSVCSNITTNATNSQFQNNLDILLSCLSSNASTSEQFNASSGKYPDRIYGQYMCLNYIPRGTCADCVKEASEAIKQACQSNIEATERQEFCQLRYSKRNFIGHLDVSQNTLQWNPKNISSNWEKFSSIVNNTINDLINKAALDPSANFYATGDRDLMGKDKIYALVQCTTDISPNDCETCLRVAFENVSTYYSSARGVRIYSFSCYLRYELYDFIKRESNPGIGRQQTGKGRLLIPMVALAVLVVVIFGFIGYWLSMKRGNAKQNNREAQLHIFGDSHYADQQQYFKGRFGLNSKESPFIGLEDILEATDNFSESNKLGEGGFGPVYKGALSNGKEVAVKRLSIESEQGTEEFTNEVLLIMKLQHKNLVRLLGFCIDGQEKLLVYEFMPNRSLDVILFDRKKRAQLDWSRSINIIQGIARGILYLHQDSPLRIIHRDLKASNILLDSDMNPKISDFGMARIYGGSEGTTNTSRIVGTYGYMSPEYAMEGLYSIKSDVFSFGVLLLEIITGRRNMGFHRSKRAPSLIAYVWELWMMESNPVELMDPLLNDSCPSDEFLRYMHIGLLCVQQDAGDRPTMPAVVSMLKRETAALPQPQRPAFSIGTFTDHYELQDSSSFVNEFTITDLLPR